MPSATEKSDEKNMTEGDAPQGAEESNRDESRTPIEYQSSGTASGKVGGGFFHIYKSGQGYWTRIGTLGGAALIGVFTSVFIYEDLRAQIPFLANPDHRDRSLWAALIFLAVYAIGVFWFTNRPRTADFLIATDSEMKKVNWTSRKELIGSTKVVIGFMFLIAFLLFILDMYFARVFHLAGILVTDSPLWEWVRSFAGLLGEIALDVFMGLLVFGGAIWAVWAARKSR